MKFLGHEIIAIPKSGWHTLVRVWNNANKSVLRAIVIEDNEISEDKSIASFGQLKFLAVDSSVTSEKYAFGIILNQTGNEFGDWRRINGKGEDLTQKDLFSDVD